MMKLSFESVGMRFGAKELIKDFTHTFEPSTITAITGANGSGKSTLLRLAAHLTMPTSGRVTITSHNKQLTRGAYIGAVAMTTPEMALYTRLTARENLSFFVGLRGKSLSDNDIKKLFDKVGLPIDALSKRIDTFSTGMRQRLKVAMMIAAAAPVWLLDEPTLGLDEKGRKMVMREAWEASAGGAIVLWATNDKKESEAADDVIELHAD